MADAAVTVPVGEVTEERLRLITMRGTAFAKAMLVAPSRIRVWEIGRVIEREVRRSGFLRDSATWEGTGLDARSMKNLGANYADPEPIKFSPKGL